VVQVQVQVNVHQGVSNVNESHIISSRYLWGSDGDLNFFFRPKGEIFIYQMGDEEIMYTQLADEYIIQWGGNPLYDSGYDCETFETFSEGLKVWEMSEVTTV
jgi:hypothetical protein